MNKLPKGYATSRQNMSCEKGGEVERCRVSSNIRGRNIRRSLPLFGPHWRRLQQPRARKERPSLALFHYVATDVSIYEPQQLVRIQKCGFVGICTLNAKSLPTFRLVNSRICAFVQASPSSDKIGWTSDHFILSTAWARSVQKHLGSVLVHCFCCLRGVGGKLIQIQGGGSGSPHQIFFCDLMELSKNQGVPGTLIADYRS